jgi:hypothetical protein
MIRFLIERDFGELLIFHSSFITMDKDELSDVIIVESDDRFIVRLHFTFRSDAKQFITKLLNHDSVNLNSLEDFEMNCVPAISFESNIEVEDNNICDELNDVDIHNICLNITDEMTDKLSYEENINGQS